MTKKATLESIKDLLTPVNNHFNIKNKSNIDIKIDRKNDRLVLSDGRVYLENKKCKTWEDQKKQLNVLHKARYDKGK